MKRKLIKQGKGGFTIYLPKMWIDSRELGEGDSINISENDNFLIVGCERKKKKEITIDIKEENKEDIKNLLTHIYRKGFDLVTIKNTDLKSLRQIKNVTSELLLGFEITDRGENYCILENLSEPTEKKYDSLLKQNFLIIKETIDFIISDFGKYEGLKEVEDLMKQQDKFILFCRRILLKEKFEKDSITNWELLTFLMHIQHSLYYMYKHTSENKIKKDYEVLRVLINIRDYFDLIHKAYFKKDIKCLHKINKLKDEYVFKKSFELLEKSKGQKATLHAHFRGIFRWIQLSSSPVMSTLLEDKI